MIAGFLAADLHVFPQLNGTFGAKDEGPPVAPSAESLWGEPVDPNVIRSAGVGDQGSFAEILETGSLRVGEISDGRMHHARVSGARKSKKLFELVTADVAKDAAKFFPFEEPSRTRGLVQTMGPQS